MRIASRVCSVLAVVVYLVHAHAIDVHDVRIPMRDGTRIYATVIFPGDPAADGPWPVTLRRNIYGRVWSVDAFLDVFKGYVAVIGEMRGLGDNEGEFCFYADDGWGELQDGVDTVQWILDQPWCDGRIGTVGGSALGMAQILMAGASADLTCQIVEAAPSNFYKHLFYEGGVLRKALVEQSVLLLGGSAPDAEKWKEHPSYDAYWEQFDADARAAFIDVPALHIGGWWDTFQKATLDHYVARQFHGGDGARGQQRLIMRATTHAPFPPNLPFRLPDALQIFTAAVDDMTRFFEAYLKGIDNGYLGEPPVKYYVIGDDTAHQGPGWEWRAANHWPPFPFEHTPFYLDPSGILTTEVSVLAPGALTYAYNPDDPVPSRGGADLFGFGAGQFFSWGPWDQREVSNRRDVLKFITPPLEAPLEITGHVAVRLFVSSDAVDTDFTAKLVDIYPDGREMLMLDSIQRVKYREGYEAPLPPPLPGEIVEVEIDLGAISLIFNQGHRVGMFVSSSNYPRFEVNPNNGDDFPGDHPFVVANNTVHLGPKYPSALMLPVRYPDRDIDGDGLPDEIEYDRGYDMNNPDTDGDSLPDGWEFRNGLDPASATGDDGPDGDPDHDGFTNLQEFQRGSHPKIPEGEQPTTGCHGGSGRTSTPGAVWCLLAISILTVFRPRQP